MNTFDMLLLLDINPVIEPSSQIYFLVYTCYFIISSLLLDQAHCIFCGLALSYLFKGVYMDCVLSHA